MLSTLSVDVSTVKSPEIVALEPVIPATTKSAAAYPVALVLTVEAGSVCVSANNLNVLSVDAS